MKKFLKWTGIVLAVLAVIGVSLYMIYLQPFISKMKHTELLTIAPNFMVITGGGGNTGIFQSDSLVVVIDSKMDEAAKTLHDNVKALAKSRPILVINTHWHPDHVGGNILYDKKNIMAGASYKQEEWEKEAGKESLPGRWLKDQQVIPMGSDTLIVFNLQSYAHTPSDVMVYSKQYRTLFGGDVILNKQHPILLGKASADAYVQEIMKAMQTYDIQRVVPGHGAVGGPEVLNDFLGYFEDMKTAAANPEQEKELVKRYESWNAIPFVMSSGATIKHYRKQTEH